MTWAEAVLHTLGHAPDLAASFGFALLLVGFLTLCAVLGDLL